MLSQKFHGDFFTLGVSNIGCNLAEWMLWGFHNQQPVVPWNAEFDRLEDVLLITGTHLWYSRKPSGDYVHSSRYLICRTRCITWNHYVALYIDTIIQLSIDLSSHLSIRVQCMHGCMDACMDAWMHVCMYAWMHECMNVCIHGCMYVRTYVYIYRSGLSKMTWYPKGRCLRHGIWKNFF